MAVYVFAGGETALAQKCLLRARLLMLTVHGEDHPYTATLDVGYNTLVFTPGTKKAFDNIIIDNIYTLIVFLAELSWVGADRRSDRAVLKERPPTQHFLL